MPTYTKAGSFGWAGGGKAGAIVDLWAASRFTAFPTENQAPPSGIPDAGPVTTGETFGNPGGYFITGVPSVQDYYVRVQYGGMAFWGPCPGGTLGGQAGGGGGGVGNTIITHYPLAYNTAGLLTGATLFTPAVGDVLVDFWVHITTAWNGLTPTLDLGTFTTAGPGMLKEMGAAPISLSTADAALTGNLGLSAGLHPSSLTSAETTSAWTNGPPVPRQQITFTATNPIKATITQDGSNATAVKANVAGTGAPTSPLTVSGSNNQFTWIGETSAGGGTANPETFTVASGTYTGAAAIATAMAAATGSLSSEAFSTRCQVTTVFGVVTLVALTAGAGYNGNQVSAGTNDFCAPASLASPSILAGGVAGDPAASQGAATLYVVTATPL